MRKGGETETKGEEKRDRLAEEEWEGRKRTIDDDRLTEEDEQEWKRKENRLTGMGTGKKEE